MVLENELLKGTLEVMKHMVGDLDMENLKKLCSVTSVDDMGHLEDLNQSLIAKERMSNDELQEARKELIEAIFYIHNLENHLLKMHWFYVDMFF